MCSALPLVAQGRAPRAADTVRAGVAIGSADLRNLVVAQEVFFSTHGRYATSLDSLRYAPTVGSRVKLTVVRRDGWAAVLTRDELTGSCVM